MMPIRKKPLYPTKKLPQFFNMPSEPVGGTICPMHFLIQTLCYVPSGQKMLIA